MSTDPASTIEIIGIIGAGQMGSGIAHVAALHGIPVRLLDQQKGALEKALGTIGKNLERQVAKGLVTSDDRDKALSLITISSDYESFGDCDLVIEAATEKEAVKQAIYKTALPHLKPSCIIASNTSSIPITRLAACTDRPDRFIGMHFMNPVPIMKLIEIIRGIATSEATFQTIEALSARLEKTTAVSEDFPAFIVNRILIPMINEAVYALYEGVGTVSGIDTGLKLGANHPMGPLELADFIGLDTCLSIMQVLHEGLADSKYRPCPLLKQMTDAGLHGRKTGRGFYAYNS